jgi:PadR family transcriptional regulator, regulatory protein AphA
MPMVSLPLTLEYALLGFVLQQPIHAYDIHRALREARGLGLIWRLKQSQLYALLTKLEEQGYLTSTTEPQGTRPPRRMLRLTDAGRQAFARWLAEPVTHGRDIRQEFLAKLYFAQRDADPARLTELIDRQRQACLAQRTRLSAGAVDGAVFDRLVQEFRVGQLDHVLAWLDRCATELTAPVAQHR